MSEESGKVIGHIEMNPATGAWKYEKASPLAAPAGSARAWTNLQIRKWADRHNIQGSMADIRCAFEDAATTPPNAEVRRGGPDATKP